MVHLSLYDGQMQSGDIIMNSDSNAEWKHVIPGSFGEILINMACK